MIDQLGTIALVLGAALHAAAEYTDRGRTSILWLNNTPVDRLLRSTGYAVAALGAIATAYKIATLGTKAQRADDADAAEFALVTEIRRELREITTNLKLFSDGRASAFVRGASCFYLAGRFSLMDKYDKCSGRDSYELGEGVLGEAGNRAKHQVRNLPSAGTAIEPNPQWLDRQRAMGVLDEHARTMTMRSRSYAGLRLNFEQRPVGVVVVESEKADGVSLAALESCETAHLRLSRLLDHASRLDPVRLRAAVTRCLEEGRA